jgi:hypothetical protein
MCRAEHILVYNAFWRDVHNFVSRVFVGRQASLLWIDEYITNHVRPNTENEKEIKHY